MATRIIRKGDAPEPWNGAHDYQPGAQCTNRGRLWEAGQTGIHNGSIEPGGIAGGNYWIDKGELRATLGALVDMLEREGFDWRNAEFSIGVSDGNRNFEICAAPRDLWGLPRIAAIASTGEPARLRFDVTLHSKRLVARSRG